MKAENVSYCLQKSKSTIFIFVSILSVQLSLQFNYLVRSTCNLETISYVFSYHFHPSLHPMAVHSGQWWETERGWGSRTQRWSGLAENSDKAMMQQFLL